MTSPERPASVRPVEYKGEPLDAERGPGLGCFRFQLLVLLVLVILTPLSVVWEWDPAVSAGLLILTLILLLFAGQTVIFLLRLVAADRREGRRRPLAGATPTVGELEDRMGADMADDGSPGAAADDAGSTSGRTAPPASGSPDDVPADAGSGDPGMRE